MSTFEKPDYTSSDVAKTALSQEEMDRYVELSKAYIAGPNIPFEIQLLAHEKYNELPTGIEISKSIGISVVQFLKEIISLRDRKNAYGVAKGVYDPEALLEVKQQAVVIYTRCALEIAESEVKEENQHRKVYFPQPKNATVGKNGYIRLFPNYPDSPVGLYRGETGAAFDALECVKFIGKHFPDVEDEILKSLGG